MNDITTSTENKTMDPHKKYILHSVIGIILMFGIGYLPPFDPITPLGMKCVGILAGLIYLWSLVDMLWPSILGLVALTLTGMTSGSALTPQAFGSDMLILVILSMAVVFALTNTGMFDYVTNWLLTRQCFQGRPWLLTAFILFGFYFICVLGGGLAIMFLLWQLIYSIADKAGMKKTHPYCAAMFIGLIMGFVGGGGTLPFKPNYLFVIGTFQKMTGMPDIPMITATIMNVAMFVSMLIFYILLIRFVIRIDVTSLKTIDPAQFVQTLPPMSKKQKFAGAYLIVFIVALMLPGLIGLFSQGVVSQALQNMGTIGMCWLLFAILCIIRIDGEPILVFSKVAHQIQWDAVALMAIAFTLSPLLTSEQTGISAWTLGIVSPMLGGQSSYFFMIILFTIMILMTNIANNTVVMMLLMTVMASFIPVLDLNLPIIALLMIPMAQTAFLLPASSFTGALVHSQASQVSAKNLYLFAVMSIISALLMMVLVAIPLGAILLK